VVHIGEARVGAGQDRQLYQRPTLGIPVHVGQRGCTLGFAQKAQLVQLVQNLLAAMQRTALSAWAKRKTPKEAPYAKNYVHAGVGDEVLAAELAVGAAVGGVQPALVGLHVDQVVGEGAVRAHLALDGEGSQSVLAHRWQDDCESTPTSRAQVAPQPGGKTVAYTDPCATNRQ